jgi:hypothetical protein
MIAQLKRHQNALMKIQKQVAQITDDVKINGAISAEIDILNDIIQEQKDIITCIKTGNFVLDAATQLDV